MDRRASCTCCIQVIHAVGLSPTTAGKGTSRALHVDIGDGQARRVANRLSSTSVVEPRRVFDSMRAVGNQSRKRSSPRAHDVPSSRRSHEQHTSNSKCNHQSLLCPRHFWNSQTRPYLPLKKDLSDPALAYSLVCHTTARSSSAENLQASTDINFRRSR